MSRHRVGRLELRVHAVRPDADLAGAAEAFTRAVLERCGDRLEAQAPGRRFFVRRLPLRWTLEAARLGDPTEIERLAVELAADLAAGADEPDLEPTSADVVAFEDDAHWRAAHWHAAAQGRDTWYFAALGTLEEALAQLASPPAVALLPAVLARLARHDALPDALAAVPDATLAALESAARSVQPAAHVDRLGTRRPAAAGEALDPARPAARTERALALAALAQARAAGISQVETPVARMPAAHPSRRDEAPGVEPPVPALPVGVVVRHTELGGLFFLLNPLLELRVGELLYTACLPEGELLRAALGVLLDAPAHRDPALELCTGVADDRPPPPVAAAQQAEVALGLLEELVGALPRRGLAGLPPTALHLHGAGAARLLVAQDPASPFALFAWPAPTPQDAAAGVAAFLERWPRSAPAPEGAPALAELDSSARLRPSRTPRPALARPPAPDAPTAALLSQLAGAPCCLFAARAEDATPLAGFAVAHFTAPADVVDDADARLVTLSADSIRFAHRRAGLDRDPGWVPWLERYVRFRFIHPDDEAR